MSSRLAILRSQLSRLRRARAAARAAAAWSALGSSALLALLGCLVLDFVFRLAVGERIVVISLATAVVGWAFWRFAAPLLKQGESELALAAIVEREHQIDSDLIAALQFESALSRDWGSPQLSGAVVDYVAAAAPSINVFKGFQSTLVMRRGTVLAGCVAVWLLLAVIAPRHLAVFANRMLLGSKHYPTRTRIDRIMVSGAEVLSDGQVKPRDCQIAQGRSLQFVVECSGRLPDAGNVALLEVGGSQPRTRLDLKPTTVIDGKRAFTAELPRLNDDITFRVSLGDAWTDAATVHVIPLPIVDLKTTAKPPAYAAGRAKMVNVPGRQPPVLEGSSIDFSVECRNGKPLQSAWLLLQTPDGARRHDLVAVDEAKLHWRLPIENPLATVRGDVQYEAQVVDIDDLSLESPIRGRIRVQPDELPTVVAETIHRIVLPTARPVVHYRATDDYGISQVSIVAQVDRARAQTAGDTPTDAHWRSAESHRFEILPAKQILTDDNLPTEGNYSLPLSQLSPAKGDSIKLTLEVIDYRGMTTAGSATGEAARSNAIILEVSDESGVMAAISQADQRSEQQLTEIIKRQLGIGGER